MTVSETLTLFGEIRKLYPNDKTFASPSYDMILSWTNALDDMSYERASEELKRHAASSRFAPTVADFRHKGKYNRTVDGYQQRGISDEEFEKLVILDVDGWHNDGQHHNGGIEEEEI